jgi:hypothetical protein
MKVLRRPMRKERERRIAHFQVFRMEIRKRKREKEKKIWRIEEEERRRERGEEKEEGREDQSEESINVGEGTVVTMCVS